MLVARANDLELEGAVVPQELAQAPDLRGESRLDRGILEAQTYAHPPRALQDLVCPEEHEVSPSSVVKPAERVDAELRLRVVPLEHGPSRLGILLNEGAAPRVVLRESLVCAAERYGVGRGE